MQHNLDIGFEIKSVQEDGFFTGYGSTFNNVDFGLDVVEKGAFTKSLDKWREKGRMPSLLWQHDTHQPIGVYTTMREDKKGLYVEGQLALKTAKGSEAHELMKMGALSGLSIGFGIKEDSFDSKTGIRYLKDLELFEVSVVTFPMNEKATINQVKELLRTGANPSEREFEKFLRDAGLSRKQAQALMSKGFSALNQSDSGAAEEKTDEVIKTSLESLLKTIKG